MSRIEDNVCKKIKARSEIGKKKYGVTMEEEILSIHEWLNHLQMELMDASVYVEKLLDLTKVDIKVMVTKHAKQRYEERGAEWPEISHFVRLVKLKSRHMEVGEDTILKVWLESKDGFGDWLPNAYPVHVVCKRHKKSIHILTFTHMDTKGCTDKTKKGDKLITIQVDEVVSL